MNELIWARAAVTRAVSLLRNMRGATSAANSAMMVTTTSISISVIPACRANFLFCTFASLLAVCMLHRHFINAGDSQHDAQNERAYHHTHHQYDQWLEQRRKALDSGTRVGFVNVRHAGEHLVEPASLFAHRQQMSEETPQPGEWE